MFRSDRSATTLEGTLPNINSRTTLPEFLGFLNSKDVQRVQLDSASTYRSRVISDSGSQFTIYTDHGIRRGRMPEGVVKCAKIKLSEDGILPKQSDDSRTQVSQILIQWFFEANSGPHRKRLVDSIYKEILVLTHERLRNNANVLHLLFYDLITEQDRYVVPALIVERAKYGSLAEHLDRQEGLKPGSDVLPSADRSSFTPAEKVGICADIILGLLALHQAGIAHGDVKSDNFLLFDASEPDIRYQVKISDFGSIILLSPSRNSQSPKYLGTRSWNAPEIDFQSGSQYLDSEGLLRCDAYSAALTMMHVVSGKVHTKIMSKERSVLGKATEILKHSDFPAPLEKSMVEAIDILLPWDPKQRCSDLSVVLEILRPRKDFAIAGSSPPTTIQPSRTAENISENTERIFGTKNYLSYGWIDANWTEQKAQARVFGDLQRSILESDDKISGRALFAMATAYAIGFGTLENPTLALKHVLDSARKGYLPARAIFEVWHQALKVDVPVDLETQIDWLYEATTWGSFYAGKSLERIVQEEYVLARQEFHARGGYNQFFYTREPPTYIGSRNSTLVTTLKLQDDLSHAHRLLFSAAIYGDESLARQILELDGADPNFTNEFGESLMVVACKGGHLPILRLLANHGASADVYQDNAVVRQSALHWLIAFEDADVLESATILHASGAGVGNYTGMQWSHPSVDVPGTFPRAASLHHAIFSGRDLISSAIIQYWPEQINDTGTDEDGRTPLDYAIFVHRANAVRILIQNGALKDLEANQICLLDVTAIENHELWANNGMFQASGEELGIECINAVAEAAPSLLDMPQEQGFTPLMQAATNHRPQMLQCFISHGCNVNTTTSFENDGRTALNLTTENHLDNEENDVISRLLEAGAVLDHRSSKGGKHVLHFTARDNKVWVARQILDLGVDIDMKTSYGETPLHCAVFYGSYEIGKLLLERGAAVDPVHSKGTFNHRDWQGLTPIALAVLCHRRDFIDLLIEYGALPLARPSHMDTVVHLAVLEEGLDALEMVLQVPKFRTPEVLDANNSREVTALHLCASNVDKHTHLRLLVEAGADVNALGGNGVSALDLATALKQYISNLLVSLASDDFYRENDEDIASSVEEGNEAPKLPLNDVKRWAEILKASDAKSVVFNSTEREAIGYEDENNDSKHAETKKQNEYVKFDWLAEERACIQVISLLKANGAKRYKEDGGLEEFLFME